MGIPDQVYAALDAATLENEYPHEYERDPKEIVLEIHDWSGIEGFDHDFPGHIEAGVIAVNRWRENNPQTPT